MVRLGIIQTGRFLRSSKLLLSKSHHTATSEYCLPNLAKLQERTVLRIKGRDTGKFLQGIVTNDVACLIEGTDKIQYNMFLNSQGRVLFDVFLYAVPGEKDEYLIECDSATTDGIISHIKQYKLRAKFEITDASKEMEVWTLFSCGGNTDELVNDKADILMEKDPRNDALGVRMVIPWNQSPAEILGIKDCSKVDSVVYNEHRYILGVAEGMKEIPLGGPLPLEYNLALINGVSFSKGCYIGQELTARTHHTGLIRKRVMPLCLKDMNVSKYPEFLPQTSLKTDSGQAAGKLCVMSGQYGLGLLRLKEVFQCQHLIAKCSEGNEVILSTSKPAWWPEDLKY